MKTLKTCSPIFAFLFLFTVSPDASANKRCVLDLQGASISLQQFQQSSISEEACKSHRDYPEFKKFVQNSQVFFITGYMNETHRDYAGQFSAALHSLSGGRGNFVRIDTDSRAAVAPDTVSSICPKIRSRLAGAANKIIFGHSKGGASALYMMRGCPDVTRAARAIVSVNGVVGGSGVADASVAAVNGGKVLEVVLDGLKSVVNATYVLKPYIGQNIAGLSLTTRSSTVRLDGLRNSLVKPGNAFCVTSSAADFEINSIDPSPAGQTAAKFLRDRMKKIFGSEANDGLVAQSKQSDAQLCPQKLHVPGANHMSLIEADNSPVSADSVTKQAFAGYLLYLVYKNDR